MKIVVVVGAILAGATGASTVASRVGAFLLVPTACDAKDCPHGGCYFENCLTSVSCSGGVCDFRNCAAPICQGGRCSFIGSTGATCPGGSCAFFDVTEGLTDGYCTGGSCTLDDKAHPSSFSSSLSV
ncbi:hypothetical protein SPRG_04124 [Saprolegnia parasitica CBS 223.65]|uniref:Uncharacterized protein n=1 Tax=Saprolegnia parasitica (strain CBS 223.65) TaxID=695850 RepID=A0A067CWM1_SAPPC|nr:hypothetical protein SPRG_04124 [Saprolegnia parasitica CBS 223.65]KDO30936.1 hypothetical protein SPRG_04124 [Saprolegnia parasitica CBS 223.65]|eukprot:XP_012198120.1 hypothetical protein SPRG_04124 [Saprolegnia parasitica CBS 223.65]